MGDDEDSSGDSSASRRRSRKDGERKRSRKRKRGHKDDRRRDRRKKHKDRKDRDLNSRRKRGKDRHRRWREDECLPDGERKMPNSVRFSGREDTVVQALCSLFMDRPAFSSELPVILIRLAGGATFDLRQMTDATAADKLEKVFESLHMFGVRLQTTSNHWAFRNPTKLAGEDELILLRLIRSALDESGVTMNEVKDYEGRTAGFESKSWIEEADHKSSDATEHITTAAANLLHDFKNLDSNLGQQLKLLCASILEGECICIDGLPNERLKDKIESIFRLCGLEKSEMEEDGDSADDCCRGTMTMGFSLPEENDDRVRIKLHILMDECQRQTETPHRRLLGPQRPQHSYECSTAASDDDEGPLPVGSTVRLPLNRSAQLAISNGETGSIGKEQREEWMIVPGQSDFLSSIKSGQSIKSRGFKNQKPPTEPTEQDIDPKIRQEIDSIKAAHSEARGPSLISQHRAKKQDKDQKNAVGKEKWQWSRDSDLDSGRKVDKNALKMVLGGAASDLHSKFRVGS